MARLNNFVILLFLACNQGDPGFSERGSKYSGGSLKEGVWGYSPPETIGLYCLDLEYI